MNRSSSRGQSARNVVRTFFGPSLLVVAWFAGLASLRATAQNAGADPNGDVQVLTRGPVHEAFAVPVMNDPKAGLVVAKRPPNPVEEMPPDQKPNGPNVQWISGYWSWDESRKDFIWISGVWREPPPGRQWVPGYWNQVAGGFQWVAGAWIPIGQAGAPGPQAEAALAQGQAEYLPAPPVSLETGPNSPSPSPEVFWSPGCWYWQQNRYVWRPGFWAAVQPTWVWVPAHYVWTPGGCLFVEGYWDLPLADRGMLFAPVYYAQPVYLQPAYVYSPTITIATPGLVANLFVQPSYNHYCFGDYYDQTFLTAGIFPWFSFTYTSGPRPPAYYDPLFTFYASVNVRHNPGWAAHCREEYILRRDNIAMRPPRTYIEQTRIVQNNININITNNVTVINRGGRPGGAGPELARPITQVAARQTELGAARMERLNAESRRQWQTRAQNLSEFRAQRASLEREVRNAPGGGAPGAPVQGRPRPFAMAESPIAAPVHHHAAPGQAGPLQRPQHQASTATPAQPRTPQHADRPQPNGVARPRHEIQNPQAQPRITHQDAGPNIQRPQRPMHADSPATADRPRHAPRADAPAPNLHAPQQFTHRQPPPLPRPAAAAAAAARREAPRPAPAARPTPPRPGAAAAAAAAARREQLQNEKKP
jgi:WXXGXW repeat (2 copies)